MDFRTDSLAGDELELRDYRPIVDERPERGRIFHPALETLFIIMVVGSLVSMLFNAW